MYIKICKSCLFIFFIFFLSCAKKSELIKNGDVVIIRPENTSIEDLKAIEWKVGKYAKQEISKGLSFRVYFPFLKTEDLLFLVKERKIDSWIFKITKVDRKGKEVIGRYYIPLVYPGRSKNAHRIKQIPFGVLKIYYAAASISSRLERSLCPVNGHNKLLKGFSVQKNFSVYSRPDLVLSKVGQKSIVGKVETYSYNPSSMNGGASLLGDYILEMALANSKEKKIYSNYFSLKEKIEIKLEAEEMIEGCENYEQPQKRESIDPIKKFRFGR